MGQCWTKLFHHHDYHSHQVQLVSRNVHHVTTTGDWEDKQSEAERDGKIIVANFSASWCSPCRQILQLYSELAEKYSSLMFLTLDVVELAEFSSTWDIKATPTFFFLKNGRQLDKLVGANKPDLEMKVAARAELCNHHSHNSI